MLFTIIYIFLFIVIVYYYTCTKPKNYPPGPKWYPLIGCFPQYYQLKKKKGFIHLAFEALSETYGSILGLKLGQQKIVLISSYDLVKKAMMIDDFNGRPNGFFFEVRSFGKKRGIVFSDGPYWTQNRKFTMKHLKSAGFGQQILSEKLDFEAKSLMEFLLEQSKSGSIAIQRAFDIAVLNMVWTTFAGCRLDYGTEISEDLLCTVHEAFRLNNMMGGLVSQLPFLRFIMPKFTGYSDLMNSLNKLWSYFNDEIDNHIKNLTEDDPRDLIDKYLIEINKEKKGEETIFDRENLLTMCLDLFLAGSKTTSDTLAWIMSFLVINPQWKKELHRELNKVVGRDRSPTLDDMKDLPFMEAFIAEIQRFVQMAPLGVPRRATKDVSLNGYLIPKDAVVILNYNSAHNDKSYWKNPGEFCPQRFLDDEGKFRVNIAFMPFGLGKRRCLGENLARSTVFVFFANLLHHFDFEVDENCVKPDMKGYDGFLVSPKPFYLKLTQRGDT